MLTPDSFLHIRPQERWLQIELNLCIQFAIALGK